ncbi:MAG: hypothetical protein ABI036_12660 [Fibrobacteria bacterium]
MQLTPGISIFGVLILAGLGLALTWLSFRNRSSQGIPGSGGPAALSQGIPRDLDGLFADISRALRALSAPSRYGGMGLMREKHAEVRRLLFELQRRLRLLEDGVRDKYEARAHRILAQAARFDITLPPP